ncbi:MAG: hypothetical protein HZA52_02335 [Planctomycetes bacterium]|nr:hypothetical protein [Planctomycetota bacterium]
MEFVFVVRRSELFPEFYPHGLVPFGPSGPSGPSGPIGTGASLASFEHVIEERGFFVEREHAEHDPSLKQVIPYAVVVRAGEVLLLKRTKKGGDARLFDKLSIGVGGHINPVDALVGETRVKNPLVAGTRRELDEELDIRGAWSVRSLGLLNDDSNSVGAVHVGLVQVVHVQGAVEIREKHVLQGEFTSLAELSRLLRTGANYETWSAKLVEHFERAPNELLDPSNTRTSVALA